MRNCYGTEPKTLKKNALVVGYLPPIKKFYKDILGEPPLKTPMDVALCTSKMWFSNPKAGRHNPNPRFREFGRSISTVFPSSLLVML